MRIAIVTSDKWLGRCRGDQLLRDALFSAEMTGEIVSWEQARDWAAYDLVVLRSAWDYYRHYDAFCRWLKNTETAGARIANGAEAILWNIDKARQFQSLSGCSVPLIPYRVCAQERQAEDWVRAHRFHRVVVKPTISASGFGTSIATNPEMLREMVRALLMAGHSVMVQPFVPEISRGEISLIYFHGRFSHAVERHPGVLAGILPPLPMPEVGVEWMCAGDQICRWLRANRLLYLRVDLVLRQGAVSVMEVELAEPDLYLGLNYGGRSRAEVFAEEIRSEIVSPQSETIWAENGEEGFF